MVLVSKSTIAEGIIRAQPSNWVWFGFRLSSVAAAKTHPPTHQPLNWVWFGSLPLQLLQPTHTKYLPAQETMDDRFNTPHTAAVQVDVFGYNLVIMQDPNSKHLGTTVWDSSIVLAKFLERNCKKGEFSALKLSGKRVIELGAGCGLAGLAMGLLGCHVTMTDQVEVLPLLLRNVERNMSRAKLACPDGLCSGHFGTVAVAELNWGNELQIAAMEPPFDYIVGTDIVYAEHLLQPLFQTMVLLAGSKTTVLMAYEFRENGLDEKLLSLCRLHFDVKKVPHSKMDSKYQHPNIQLYLMRRRLHQTEIQKDKSG
ncbi:hypothetical protein O6H91_15G012700 [Diphasiastrum complanatum]|uniref:Uncharacterized protein n=1 Tax=Diphasiastrum complanatum TaxID=34168 RepID=A0ACC2BFY1_DIPCM|nr:hypothetical protein O6H91_15G012700 [Diphasiastrum complanatum]